MNILLRVALVGLAIGALLHARPAQAAGACPYSAAGYADGCYYGPPNGAYQQTAFGTYARQSGQHWSSPHPQPWNVAGWDYAVGYSRTPLRSMYPLVRPDQAAAGGVAAGTNLPYLTAADGCVYTATGNPAIPGGPAIVCRGRLPANGVGLYAGQAVISGIDFSADAQGHCTQLYIDLDTAQTVYVINNNFRKGPGCYVANQSNADALINVVVGQASLVARYNMFDGAAPYLADRANSIFMGGSGVIDLEFNAFLHNAGRVADGDGRAGWYLKYNYIDGMAISPSAPHGEVAGAFPNTPGATIFIQDDEFNTVVWGANTVGVGGVNAALFLSGGGPAQTLVWGRLTNNTLVSNLEYGGRPSSGKVLLSIEIPHVQNLILRGNYADPSGAWLCMQMEGDEIQLSGYIDDGRGPGGAYDGRPGNVLHITSRQGKDAIVVGAQLYQILGTGFPGNPVITGAAGASCGGVVINGSTTSTALQTAPAATYCLSGPPLAVPAFSGVQTMPQTPSYLVTGNVNLIDGSPITRGTNIQWNNGTCNGAA